MDSLIRLNKYISNSGVCSRRHADVLIKDGKIKVNGKVITELGTKISPSDKVEFGNKLLSPEKLVYVLLNKPKDHITTLDDPQVRKTVMHLVRNATKERIYPVGRLDRNTTGLLLFTNDGELAKKLSHPSYQIQKIYLIETDKNISETDLTKILQGVDLEDGKALIDSVNYVEGNKREIAIELHIGKNRIIRRIFEHLGYEIIRLDRVVYAGLNKIGITRGKWRFLKPLEIVNLKKL